MIGKKLTPFKFWCQKVLPTVYDDSLSYYEYLGKLNEYLNEVIEQINTLTEAEEDFQDDLSAQWTAYKNGLDSEWLEYKTGLTAEWNTYRTQLTEAWTTTKNYIDNYFDNLDVQEEINNKLDAMVLDGTMGNLIDGVISDDIPATVTAWLTAHVDPVGSAVVVDNTLSITGAAADAKISGDKFKINAENISYLTESNFELIYGEYLNVWGSIQTDANGVRSDYIPVISGTKIHVVHKISSTGYGLAFFDYSKTLIPSESIAGTGSLEETDVTVPSGAYYAMVCGYSSNLPCLYTIDDKSYVKTYNNELLNTITKFKETAYVEYKKYYSVNSFYVNDDNNIYATPLIPVTEGEVLKYSTYMGSTGYELLFFNKILHPIIDNAVVGRANVTENTVTVPDNACFVQMFCYGASSKNPTYIKNYNDELNNALNFATLTETGYYSYSNLVNDANGKHSDYIPCKKGYVVEFQLTIANSANYLTFFNKNKEYIGRLAGGTSNRIKTTYTVTDENCAYVIGSAYSYFGTVCVYDSVDTYEYMHRKEIFDCGFGSFAVFRKFCVIGDSLSVGATNYPDSTASNEELDYCWGAFIARRYGSKCVNRGFSGATAESWLTNPLGLTAFQQESTKSQCYFIALGANELLENIGSPETINDTTTFYGAYKAIYDAIRTQNASAIVLMCTLPTEWGSYEQVNEAVEWLASNVGDTNTFLLDLQKFKKYFYSQPIAEHSYSHYWVNGYQLISRVIDYAVDEVMLNNPIPFAYVPKITYTV